MGFSFGPGRHITCPGVLRAAKLVSGQSSLYVNGGLKNRKAIHLGQGGVQREPGGAGAHRVTGDLILLNAALVGCEISQMDARPLGEAACSLPSVGRVDPKTSRFEGVTVLTLDGEVGTVPRDAALLGDVSKEGPEFLAGRRDVDVRYAESVVATAGHAEVRRGAAVVLVDGLNNDVFEFAIADLAVASAAFEANALAALVEQRDAWRIAASPGVVAVPGQ